MRSIDLAKALLAVLGIAVWGYGIRVGDRRLQIAGVAFVVVAFSLRLFSRRREPPL